MNDRDVVWLLDTLCTKLGFCLNALARDRFRAKPPADVESFAAAVVVAEGLDPVLMDRTLWRQVAEEVAQALARSDRDRPLSG